MSVVAAFPNMKVSHRHLRRGGRVLRYHTEPTLRKQTVAEHSWGVAMIARELYPDDKMLMIASLLHDIAEHQTGDMPAPVKWKNEALRRELERVENDVNSELGLIELLQLNALQRQRLKYCDLLELLWFCVEEMQAGSRDAKDIYTRAMDHLLNNHPTDKRVMKMVELIEEAYRECEL